MENLQNLETMIDSAYEELHHRGETLQNDAGDLESLVERAGHVEWNGDGSLDRVQQQLAEVGKSLDAVQAQRAKIRDLELEVDAAAELPALCAPSEPMLSIQVSKQSPKNAIEMNHADYTGLGAYYMCLESGSLFYDSQSTIQNTPEPCVPVPALNPEGSGAEWDRLEDFEIPSGYPNVMSFKAWRESDEGDGSVAEYLVYAEENGYSGIHADWKYRNECELDEYISNFVRGVEIGDLSDCGIAHEGFEGVKIELID